MKADIHSLSYLGSVDGIQTTGCVCLSVTTGLVGAAAASSCLSYVYKKSEANRGSSALTPMQWQGRSTELRG